MARRKKEKLSIDSQKLNNRYFLLADITTVAPGMDNDDNIRQLFIMNSS